MTCKHLLITLAVSGCAEDVPTFRTTTTALTITELVPPDDHIPTSFGHYRWELVDAPSGATLGDLSAETSTLTVTPSLRGIYVLERWFVGESSEQISDHVVVTAEGAIPAALVTGPSMGAVSTATILDGSTSSSPEQLPLHFQWRLATRPASSTAVLGDTVNPTLTVIPDVAGTYGVELRVFDGELWSEPALASLVAR